MMQNGCLQLRLSLQPGYETGVTQSNDHRTRGNSGLCLVIKGILLALKQENGRSFFTPSGSHSSFQDEMSKPQRQP